MTDPGRQHGLWPVPGDGVLARHGNLVLLSSIDEHGFIESLLDLLGRTSEAGGDGRALVDAIVAAVTGDRSWGSAQGWPAPALLAFGPAGSGLAVTVSGTAWAEITTGYGTSRLAAGQPSMLLRSVTGVLVQSVRGGLTASGESDRADRFSRLDSGTVRAGGLSYVPGQPVSQARLAFPAPREAPSGQVPARGQQAAPSPAQAGSPARPPDRAARVPPAQALPPAAQPAPAVPSQAQQPPAQQPRSQPQPSQAQPAAAHLQPAHLQSAQGGPAQAGPAQAGPAQPGPAQPGPAQPGPAQPGPAQPGPAQPGPAQAGPAQAGPAQAGPAQAGPAQARSAQPGPAQEGPGGAPRAFGAKGTAPPASERAAPAGRYESESARSGPGSPSAPGPAPPPPAGPGYREPVPGPAGPAGAVPGPADDPLGMEELGIPEPAAGPPPPAMATSLGPAAPAEPEQPTAPEDAAAAGPVTSSAPVVLGVYCKNGHFGDPEARSCAVCGTGISRRSTTPQPGPRPPLGVLILDDGASVELDGDYVIGREPMAEPSVVSGEARPLRVVDTQSTISRVHARVHLDGWQVLLTDLGSANGTRIKPPGSKADQPLDPEVPVRLRYGTRVFVGSQGLSYEPYRPG